MFIIILLSLRNGARRHVHLVPSLLVPAIMSISFFFFWCPPLCKPFVSVSAPSIMSMLLSFPFLGARHHVNLVLLVLVPAIISTFVSLSWCSPCQMNLVSRNLILVIMSTLCPQSWFQQSCPDCVPCLDARHHLNLISLPWWPFSGQTWVPILVSDIILTLCPLFWHPSSCSPCVLILVPAIKISLYPRLGAHYQVNLVSPV